MRHTVPTAVLPDDRVSDVLARDETLVDVFVRHSPHFEKLRHRALRRTMARLVTVAQAARVAGVAPEVLLRDLNAAVGAASVPGVAPSTDRAAGRHPQGAAVVELDLREDIRAGREPFPRIMAAVAALATDAVLHLRTPFEPAPLFTVLSKRGFAHESRENGPGDWSTWFWRGGDGAPSGDASATARATPPGGDATMHAAHEQWLDVRGLEPPEPMLRTLAALETLPPGHTLVQVNARIPQFLLPILHERGFEFDIDESAPERVLVRIRARA